MIDYFHKLKVGRNKEALDPKMSTGKKIKTNIPKGTSESRSFKVGNICFNFFLSSSDNTPYSLISKKLVMGAKIIFYGF